MLATLADTVNKIRITYGRFTREVIVKKGSMKISLGKLAGGPSLLQRRSAGKPNGAWQAVGLPPLSYYARCERRTAIASTSTR